MRPCRIKKPLGRKLWRSWEWCSLFSIPLFLTGKSYTMIGKDDSMQNLGIIPCAISWLFKLINERKEKTGARFSVRISAVEVWGKEENLRDLLSEVATGSLQDGQSPGVYLCEDPICGMQVNPRFILHWNQQYDIFFLFFFFSQLLRRFTVKNYPEHWVYRLESVYLKTCKNFMTCSCRAVCSPGLNICASSITDPE